MSFKNTAIIGVIVLSLSLLVIVVKISSPFGILFNLSFIIAIISIGALLCLPGLYCLNHSNKLIKILGIIPLLLGGAIIILTLIFSIDYRLLFPSTSFSNLSETEIEEDLASFDEVLKLHPAYESRISDLELINCTDCESRNELINHITQSIAVFEDGHSYAPPFQVYNKSNYYPFQGYFFDDGFYITSIASEYQEALETKLTAINGISTDSIITNLANLMGAENDWNASARMNFYLFNKESLEAVGLESPHSFTFLPKHSSEFSIYPKSSSFMNWMFWSLKPTENTLPPSMKRQTENYSISLDDTFITMKLSLIEPASDEFTIEDLAHQLDLAISENPGHKVIFDLRNNSGGNNTLYQSLIDVILKYPTVNRENHFYVFTSEITFSAGVNFVDDLRFETNATLIGKPTGAGPTHFGDAQMHFLPNSGIFFFLSTRIWEANDSTDTANQISPDIWINYTSDDFLNKRDPWLEKIRF